MARSGVRRVSPELRPGFDPAMADRRAECDGGRPAPGGQLIMREEFEGRLTGDYVDHGDPPWRWWLMVDLVRKPDGWPGEAVWCESQSLFFLDED
jgi:hypothetical protein